MLCKCGCGQPANWGEWVRGHWNKGIKFTEEHKQKISEANLGKKGFWDGKHRSEETKQKISEAQSGEKSHMFGKHRSEETRAKLSIANSGKHLPDEHKQKMSEAMMGHEVSVETRAKLSQSNMIHGRSTVLAKHHEHKKQECLFGCKNVKRYEQHHEPAYEDILMWEGRLVNLCVNCHKRVHYGSLELPDNAGILWSREETVELLGDKTCLK